MKDILSCFVKEGLQFTPSVWAYHYVRVSARGIYRVELLGAYEEGACCDHTVSHCESHLEIVQKVMPIPVDGDNTHSVGALWPREILKFE